MLENSVFQSNKYHGMTNKKRCKFVIKFLMTLSLKFIKKIYFTYLYNTHELVFPPAIYK